MKTRPLGVVLGLAGNFLIAWALYHLLQIGSCGDVGQPACPSDAWPYFVGLPAGIMLSVLAGFLGGGIFAFAGTFLAVGLGSLAAGFFGDEDDVRSFAFVFGGIFTATAMLPLVVAGFGRRRMARAERLVASGKTAIGTVLAVEDTGVTINDNPRVRLRVRIEPEDGSPTFEGEKAVTVSRVAIPRAGDRFPVWYDPAEPDQFGLGTEVQADASPQIRALFAKAGKVPEGEVAFTEPAAVAPAPAPAPKTESPIDEIARLNDLRMKGALTDEEFTAAKARLLQQL